MPQIKASSSNDMEALKVNSVSKAHHLKGIDSYVAVTVAMKSGTLQ
jgi:hypothetical protein